MVTDIRQTIQARWNIVEKTKGCLKIWMIVVFVFVLFTQIAYGDVIVAPEDLKPRYPPSEYMETSPLPVQSADVASPIDTSRVDIKVLAIFGFFILVICFMSFVKIKGFKDKDDSK